MNPYASPKSATERQLVPSEPWFGTYYAEVSPRGLIDCVVGGAFGVLFASLLYGIPLLILFWFGAPAAAYLAVILGVAGLGVLAIMAGICRIEVTSEGLIATRRILPDMKLRWEEVEGWEMAGRMEALMATALQPHRCCSYSLTSTGQVVIYVRGSRLIFPPTQLSTFCETLRVMVPKYQGNRPNQTSMLDDTGPRG